MKTILRAIVLVFVAATWGFAQDVARMDQVVQSYVQDHTFMGTVLVARGADVMLSKGYGSANLEWAIPNTPSTKFRLGSITKQFTAASILLTASGITVAVLGNLNGMAPEEIRGKLGALAHGDNLQTPTERKEITLPAETLAMYVGTYEFMPGINLMIRPDGNQLTAQLTGQGQLPIFPESETKFFLKVVDAQLEFVKDASGAVTHVVLHQNGRDQRAARTSATVAPPPQHKEITVPVSTLSKYAGTYELRPSVELSVVLDGDHLVAQMTGQPKFPIFAESETLFFFRVVEATLEFETDASGATTAVRLRQGPVNQLLLKK
jgi:hypothetical protein